MAVNYCSVDSRWSADRRRNIENYVIYRVETDNQIGEPSSPVPTVPLTLVSSGNISNDDTLDASGDKSSSSSEKGCPPCEMLIRCRNPPYSIALTGVDIICSARFMEIYSDRGEYCITCHGIHVDEDIGSKSPMYLLQHTISTPMTSCKVKLLGLKDEGKLDLHSVHLTVTQHLVEPPSLAAMMGGAPAIDTDSLSARVESMGIDLPDNAQALLEAMKTQSKRRKEAGASVLASANMPPTLASMMAMMSSMRPTTQSDLTTPKSVGSGHNHSQVNSNIRQPDTSEMISAVSQSCINKHEGDETEKRKIQLTVPERQSDFTNDHGNESEISAVEGKGLSSTGSVDTICDLALLLKQEIHNAECRIICHMDTRIQELQRAIDSRFDQISLMIQGKVQDGTKCDIALD